MAPEGLIDSIEIKVSIISCGHSFVITCDHFPHKYQSIYVTGVNALHTFIFDTKHRC
jgi:hypothetical protein